jgi:hypothetical protein
MRIRSTLTVLALAAVPALAQGYHAHDGFYLSAGLAPAWGDINQSVTNGPITNATFGGTTGLQLDLRIGGTITRNNILSFDLSSRAMVNPTVTVGGQSVNPGNNTSVGAAIIGVGFTHYFMPANAFLGVTLGQGTFTLTSDGNSGSSEKGFGYIIRAGKEWWVGRRWGLGVVAGVSHLSASDQNDPNYPGYASTLSTTGFFAGFSATFN